MVSAISRAMVSAYRRAVSASAAQHVEAKLDPDTGNVTVFAEKEVVEDRIVDDRTEVLLEVDRKVRPNVEVGDMLVVETTPADFRSIAAQTARQVIQQRIREAETFESNAILRTSGWRDRLRSCADHQRPGRNHRLGYESRRRDAQQPERSLVRGSSFTTEYAPWCNGG